MQCESNQYSLGFLCLTKKSRILQMDSADPDPMRLFINLNLDITVTLIVYVRFFHNLYYTAT